MGFVVLVILNVVVWFDDPFLPAPEEKYETLQKKKINYKSFQFELFQNEKVWPLKFKGTDGELPVDPFVISLEFRWRRIPLC